MTDTNSVDEYISDYDATHTPKNYIIVKAKTGKFIDFLISSIWFFLSSAGPGRFFLKFSKAFSTPTIFILYLLDSLIRKLILLTFNLKQFNYLNN